jgi:3-phosphoshikimate 1-carboxyvinyltransferase
MLSEVAGSVTVTPARRLGTEAPPIPGDKSISHRAVLFGALADGETTVTNLAPGKDVASSAACVAALGASVERRDSGALRITGGAWRPPEAVLDCGNSGTTMRLLMGALAMREVAATLDGDASLRRRPMRRIAEPLGALGASIETTDGHAPVQVRGSAPLVGRPLKLAIASAQLATSLTIAATGARGRSELDGAVGARDHTERMLPHFGVHVERRGSVLVVDGPQRFHGCDLRVPGDPSAAAFWLAAAAIVPGARIAVRGVCLNPTRIGFVRALERMGAGVRIAVEHEVPEPAGTIEVVQAPLRAIALAEDEVPAIIDELPLLGVVAAYARGTTTVRGAAELRVKESDRIEVLAAGLRALGIEVATLPDGFDVSGGTLAGGRVDSGGDHRLAMAFAIGALGAADPVTIDDAACVAISHPSFFAELERLCA